MAFDVAQFLRTNKVLAIWGAFFGLVWLINFYGLFGLVFITYILCFLFHGPIERLATVTRLSRILWTVVIYVVFLAVVLTLLAFILPRLGAESTAFLKRVPDTLEKLRGHLDEWAWIMPDLTAAIAKVKDYLSLEALVGVKTETMFSIIINTFNQITTSVSTFLLGTLFSFLIMLDFPKLRTKAIQLRQSRLRDIYDVTARSVVRFAVVVGMGFRAQILIAAINTALTALGMLALGIEPIALLSTVVFFLRLDSGARHLHFLGPHRVGGDQHIRSGARPVGHRHDPRRAYHRDLYPQSPHYGRHVQDQSGRHVDDPLRGP